MLAPKKYDQKKSHNIQYLRDLLGRKICQPCKNVRMRRNSSFPEVCASDLTQNIINWRSEIKDGLIDSAMFYLKRGLSVSVVMDLLHKDCLFAIGKVLGMYRVAHSFDVITDNEYDKLMNDVMNVYDEDVIIQSAINKMEGKKENGYKA